MATVSSISEDKIVQLEDGIRINYCTSGNGDHPVLLLPGALGSICIYVYVLQHIYRKPNYLQIT